MKYIIRSLKYLLVLCVLYVALMWLSSISTYGGAVDTMTLLRAQLASDRGVWLVVAFVALAVFYPRFGFMTSRVEGVSLEHDKVRLDNAMRLYGFEEVGAEDGALIYRAKGMVKRLMFMYEDRIEVREVDGGVEIKGIRRAVARIGYQLGAYIHNSRFEDKE